MDRRREALASIDNAVQLLDGRASLYSLGRAYEFSAHLTGNRVHRRRAGEIKAHLALTPPAQ
jgi:hypothetical protein